MKKKILYVDDEKINLLLFENNFKKFYTVLVAKDGFEGLKVLDENTDTLIIISDMRMPGMTGIEFITKAKAKYPDKKFYILTGFEITQQIREALDTGLILEYFKKPFEIKKIHAKIAEALNN
ncbi:CheY-like chemotaxis protein [Wenyingzhuangia heitensis]|uniref:CheY-like chemotaxis protein n=1 Tax=Wenyingzhuangia heitensis TaxID=1487859 RepID=A0ABX0UEZ5_9FLAO|nr:response regulator [Wenyingzhuangia heitensis]NIJ45602.1 CheY-like chemotaxis protein [Wenyingzhuangia heitensis]